MKLRDVQEMRDHFQSALELFAAECLQVGSRCLSSRREAKACTKDHADAFGDIKYKVWVDETTLRCKEAPS